MGDKIFDTDEKSVRRSLNSQQKDGEKLQISDNRPCTVSQVQMKGYSESFFRAVYLYKAEPTPAGAVPAQGASAGILTSALAVESHKEIWGGPS